MPPAGTSQDGLLVDPSRTSGDSASSPSALSKGVVSDKQPALLKRKRTALEDTTVDAAKDQAVDNPTPYRPTIRLPKGRKARTTVPPRPAPSASPRHPSCLADVDAVMRGAAASACLEAVTQASNTSPTLPNWAATLDEGHQDDPPDSNDDEIPLSVMTAARARDGMASVSNAEDISPRSSDASSLQHLPHLPNPEPSIAPPATLQAEPYVPPVSLASVHPKPRLHVIPPIWAEVSGALYRRMLSDRPSAVETGSVRDVRMVQKLSGWGILPQGSGQGLFAWWIRS